MKFANETEARFAALLDLIGIKYQYEPREFPLTYKPDGKIKTAVRPDFYLPLLDRWVEISDCRENTRHRRKLRALERLHGIKAVLLTRKELAIWRATTTNESEI